MAAGDVTVIRDTYEGEEYVRYCDVEMPSSYTALGQALTTAKFGLTTIDYVQCEVFKKDADEFAFAIYDRANDKMMLVGGDGGAAGAAPLKEIPNGSLAGYTGVSAGKVRVRAVGKL